MKRFIKKFCWNIRRLFLKLFKMPYSIQDQLNIYNYTINNYFNGCINGGVVNIVLLVQSQVPVDIVKGNVSCTRHYDLVLKFKYIITYNAGSITLTIEFINNQVTIDFTTNLYDANILMPISTLLTNSMQYLEQRILQNYTDINNANRNHVIQRGC